MLLLLALSAAIAENAGKVCGIGLFLTFQHKQFYRFPYDVTTGPGDGFGEVGFAFGFVGGKEFKFFHASTVWDVVDCWD